MLDGPVSDTRTDVARRAPTRHHSGCRAPGRTNRHGQPTPATGCLAPTHAIGEARVPSKRPFPRALSARARCGTGLLDRRDPRSINAPSPQRAPRGCPLWAGAPRSGRPAPHRRALSPARSPREPPLTMMGPNASSRPGDGAPNIVKDGTPHEALSSACHSSRPTDSRVGLEGANAICCAN